MTCDNCGNKFASRMSYSISGHCNCEKCGCLPAFKFSDVYFKEPYFDPNIAHPDKFPLGSQINSRAQKAALMRQLNISERGDKQHGAR